jgi:pimeloyl-ACP methyl ester carboxylesterase
MRPTEHVLDGTGPALTFVQTDGDGPPLLMLHGLGARWQVFAPLIARLGREWQLYALDFRGHGTSDRTPGRYAMEDFCADAVALLERRVGAPAVIYGHSLGGWVAMAVAAAHPELVRAIVVADSAIFPRELDPDFAVSYLADLPLALRSLAKSLNQLDPEVLEHLRDGRLTDAFDPEATLRAIACPVLLLQGNTERGALMRDEDVQRARALLGDARHVRFDALGHGLHVEDSDAVVAELRGFLGEVTRADG